MYNTDTYYTYMYMYMYVYMYVYMYMYMYMIYVIIRRAWYFLALDIPGWDSDTLWVLDWGSTVRLWAATSAGFKYEAQNGICGFFMPNSPETCFELSHLMLKYSTVSELLGYPSDSGFLGWLETTKNELAVYG